MAEDMMCGTMPLHFAAVQSETGYAETRRMGEVFVSSLPRASITEVVRIPVVVHVLASDPTYEVTAQQIHEQINILNQDFRAGNADIGRVPEAFRDLVADSLIEFRLATRDPAGRPTNGIVRRQTSIETFPRATVPPEDSPTVYISREVMLGETGSVAWPREGYLNIWVCNMARKPLGFASFPGSAGWRDGVVIDYSCFGASGTARPAFDLGRTAVHEVGHWLNLLHIWGDDDNLCTLSDNVADTPNQAGPNFKTPTYPSLTCNNAPHGDLFVNFMDYVDDVAMVMFTRGQVARMHATLQSQRASLLLSHGFDATDQELSVLSTKGVLALNAFGRAGEPEEQFFDGADWVAVGQGEGQ